MGYHLNYNSQGFPGGSEDEPLRLFIRRNRKKILIFLGVGVVAVIAIIVVIGIFLLTKVTPVGTEIVSQSINSGGIQGVVGAFINWLKQSMSTMNLSQLLNLFLQFN